MSAAGGHAKANREVEIMKKTLFLLSLSCLSGCMWGRVQVNDPTIRDRAALIRPGRTRVSELKSLLMAEPTMRMPLKDRTVLSYTYADTKANGLMLIVVNFTKSQTQADTIYVEADASGIVRHIYVPPSRDIPWEFWPF